MYVDVMYLSSPITLFVPIYSPPSPSLPSRRPLLQLQGKDEDILKKSEELTTLRAELRELQLNAPLLEARNTRLREEHEAAQEELHALRETLHTLEPKLSRLEPELGALQREREQWVRKKLQMEAELEELRPWGQLVDDLAAELEQVNDMPSISLTAGADGTSAGGRRDAADEAKAPGSPSSTLHSSSDSGGVVPPSQQQFHSPYSSGASRGSPAARGQKTPSSSTCAASSSGSTVLSLSQKHSMWVGLPSLRKLSAPLYNNIRALAHDLHSTEVRCLDLERSLQRLRGETGLSQRQVDARLQQYEEATTADRALIRSLTDRAAAAEDEVATLRRAKNALEQIKVVLTSYPGDMVELRKSLFPETSSGADADDNNSARTGVKTTVAADSRSGPDSERDGYSDRHEGRGTEAESSEEKRLKTIAMIEKVGLRLIFLRVQAFILLMMSDSILSPK